MLLTTIWLGLIGFLDDYIKIFKKNKEGLAGRFKIAGQIILGLIVGFTLFFSDDVIIVEKVRFLHLSEREKIELLDPAQPYYPESEVSMERKSTKTTIPFVKNNEFNYSWLVAFIPEKSTGSYLPG